VNRNIISKDLDYDTTEWNKVSREAKHFVKSLLKRDPNNRMTTDELFRHPWLKLKKVSET